MFICLNCHKKISGVPVGTKQRNHCPFCLWSIHLDDNIPGDRKSTCFGRMKPVGLTYKYKRMKARFRTDNNLQRLREEEIGELMIVHQCVKCGAYSKNRIAGDDKPDRILKLLDIKSNHHTWITLNEGNREEVGKQLYGLPLPEINL